MRFKIRIASFLRLLPLCRARRQWLKKKIYSRITAAGILVAFSSTTLLNVASAQCDAPLFPLQRQTTGDRPAAIARGDFNNDGHTDMATANSTNVSVLMGNGDGTFALPQFIAEESSPLSIAASDFNGDGVIDLAIGDLDSGVTVLLGGGDGSFSAHSSFEAGTGLISIATADFNGDGLTDLSIASYYSQALTVVLGNGDGTFANQQTIMTEERPRSVAIGDFNGDGLTDLAAASSEFDPGNPNRVGSSFVTSDCQLFDELPISRTIDFRFETFTWGRFLTCQKTYSAG